MPKKHSLTLEGHRTSISLEPIFWDLLVQEANDQGIPLNQLIATLDQDRLDDPDMPNLSSFLRVHVVERLMQRGG